MIRAAASRIGRAAVLGVLLSVALSACGPGPSAEPETEARPEPALLPEAAAGGAGSDYDGPLYIPAGERSRWEKRSGAAGRIVQCHNRGRRGVFEPSERHTGAVADTPGKAIGVAAGEGFFLGPTDGLQIVREERKRALFVYEVDGQTLQAFVVHHGRSAGDGHHPGWYVRSWARCDWSEFPDSAILYGIQVWSNADDDRVSTTRIQSYPGSAHCSWESMTFLEYGRHVYVRDPLPYLMADFFAEEYVADMPLPDDAVDTGYHRRNQHLWLSPDEERAYVGAPDSVELWPRTTKDLACS